MTSKKELERLASTYVVSQQTEGIKGFYNIRKLIDDEPRDLYKVTLHKKRGKKQALFCDCPGFLVQKYDKMLHKHVQMALAYQKLGEPSSVIFKLGPRNEVQHVMTVD